MNRQYSDIERVKRTLRMKMREMRACLNPADAARRAASAQRTLAALPVWERARRVALYMSFKGEMSTSFLLRQASAEGKEVLLPRCIAGEEGLLELVPCGGEDELAPGVFGILEPTRAAVDLEDPEAGPDLLCAPALACDRRGYRMGWGGGYYDRLLIRPALRASVCIGLIYAFQLVPLLPVTCLDAPLQGICTEEEILWL